MQRALYDFTIICGYKRVPEIERRFGDAQYAVQLIGFLLGSDGVPILFGISRAWRAIYGFEAVAEALKLTVVSDADALKGLDTMLSSGEGAMSSTYRSYRDYVKQRMNGDQAKIRETNEHMKLLERLFKEGTGR